MGVNYIRGDFSVKENPVFEPSNFPQIHFKMASLTSVLSSFLSPGSVFPPAFLVCFVFSV